mmetsp:Transcript_44571/g.96116  ORF Transcript_44571/g.96116 Transcript_44571/m.96116 type:complete len:305 (+) Transcript_44571:121-1035(+)
MGGPNKAPEGVLLAGAATASHLATALYLSVTIGHVYILWTHASLTSSSDPIFFGSLAVVDVSLAFEAALFAVGAFAAPGRCLSVLAFAGRVNLLAVTISWPWLVPWVVELSCRSRAVSVHSSHLWLNLSYVAATCFMAFVMLREAFFLVVPGPFDPSSGLAASASEAGCLPGQPVFGGAFRLDKATLEETGRAVFVPIQKRENSQLGSGLAVLSHIIASVLLLRFPPWQAMGVAAAVVGRVLVPQKFPKKDPATSRYDPSLLWRREVPRLSCRLCELAWMWCCLKELQLREANPSWLPSCAEGS